MADPRLEQFETKMNKTFANLEGEFQSIRAGRANPHILDKLSVDYYGMPTPVKNLANISVPEPRMLVISPFDPKAIPEIEKGIMAADIGITPQNDGKLVRLTIPQVTEERRKELTKVIKKMGEDAKVAVRNERRDANDHLKKAEKAGELTEDDLKGELDDVQKVTDKAMKEIDEIIAHKEKELMEI